MAESVSSRITRLQQLLSGRIGKKVPLLDKEALLDSIMVLYSECSSDYMTRDKNIATFIKKFKPVIDEIQKLRLKISDFEIKKTIGRGHFGEVHVVREKVTGNVYAMKVLKKNETLSQDNVAFFEEEKDIMAFADNPWITKLQYAFQDMENLYLVMDFHQGGDLLGLLSKYDDVLDEDMARFYLAEMVMAIHAVHALGYVHRDIKPENVLIDRTGHIKLVDFGSSARLSSAKMVHSKMPVGTPEYIAPEVLTSMDGSSGKYGIECDWWSLGVCMYEMLVGNTPFEADSVVVVYSLIMDFKNSLSFPDDLTISDDAKDLIRRLLSDRKDRINYEGIANHGFFKGIDWTTLKDAVPPYVPTISSIDDTSNFDEFESESSGPRIEDFMKGKEGFNGKNLPFIGFSFTRQLNAGLFSDGRYNEPASPLPETGPSRASFSSQKPMKSQELKETLQALSTANIELENTQKQVKEFKKALEEKNSSLKKAQDERDAAEKAKVLFDTEIKSLQRRLDMERADREKAENETLKLVNELQENNRKADGLRDLEMKKMLEEQKQLITQLEQERFTVNKRAQHLENELTDKKKLLEESKIHASDLKAKLSKVNEDTKSNVSDLQQKLSKVSSDSETRIKEFQEKLTKTQTALQQTNDQLITIEREKEDLLRDIEELRAFESKVKEDEVKEEARRQASSSAEQHLRDELRAKSDRVIELEKDREDLKKQIEELEMRYKQLLEGREEMKKELNSKIKELEETLEGVNKDQKMLQQLHEKLQQEFEEKKQASENKDEKINSLKETCKKLDEQVKTIMADRSLDMQMKEREKKLEGDVHTYKQKIDVLKQEKTSLEHRFNLVQSDFKSEQQRNATLKKRLDNSEKQLLETTEHFEAKTSRLQAELTKANTEAERAMKDLATTRKSADSLHDKIMQLQVEVENQRHIAQDSAGPKAVEDLESKIKILTKSLNDAKTERKSYDVKLRHANKQVTDLKMAKEQVEEELKEKQRQYESHDLTIAMLKQTCTMLEGQVEELEVMNDEYQDREDQWNILKRQLYDSQEKLEEQLEETLKALDLERSQRQKLVERYSSVEDNMDEIKKESTRKTDQLEYKTRQQESRISELNEMIIESEKKQALAEVNIRTSERKLDSEIENNKKLQAEVSRLTDLMKNQKTSNFALSQELEAAKEKIDEFLVEKENLQNQIERTAYAHAEEKIKLESTLAQQTKLIDFLNAKVVEETPKGKKGKFYPAMKPGKAHTVDTNQHVPRRYREVEQALEKEKNTNIQLHVQLTNALQELQQVRTELVQIKSLSRTSTISAPGTPTGLRKEDKLLQMLQKSPGSQSTVSKTSSVSESISDMNSKHSGSTSSENSMKSQISTERMHHNIPHRMQTVLNMRPSKCPVCLITVHFGKQVSKCSECGVVCHLKCVPSLENTCGLPNRFVSHFSNSIQENRSLSARDSAFDSASGDIKLSGWLKIPRKGSAMKQGWEKKWIVLEDMKLSLYDNENTVEGPFDVMDLDVTDGEVNVNSAVPASELVGTASTDVPYAMSVELVPYTTCWPGRTLYILALSFEDKQKWACALESVANDIKKIHRDEIKGSIGKVIVHLEGKDAIDTNCTINLNDDVMLIGAEDALYGITTRNGGKKKPVQIPGIGRVYQMSLVEDLCLIIAIVGKDRVLCRLDVKELSTKWRHIISSSRPQTISSKVIEKIRNCHLFAVGKCEEAFYLCAASANRIFLLRYHNGSFLIKQEFETSEPCSCIQFTRTHVVYGVDKFYCVDVRQLNSPKEFLDSSDTTLAFAVFGMTQVHTFPIAIFSVKNSLHKEELLLCYNEFGVFVDDDGRRTRPCDLKWNRLPLSFEYRQPFLYVGHFNSIEVCNIPLDISMDVRTFSRKFVDIINPRFLGFDVPAASLVLSSSQGFSMDILSFRGNMVSGFTDVQVLEEGAFGPDITRSTSSVSICSDEETSRKIGKQSPVPFRRKAADGKSGDKKDNRLSSFRIPFSFKSSKRNSQFGD